MSLKDKLMADLKTAMKEKEKVKKAVITMIRASVKQYEVDNREEIDDEGIIEIVAKQMKQKKDAIEEFKKGDRPDLVKLTEEEMEILLEYLPKQLSKEEVEAIISETIEEVGAKDPKDMGKVMGALMPKVKGKADGKLVSQIVKDKLS